MDINVRTLDRATIVDLAGELDATTAAIAQERILPLASQGGKLLLEMTGVTYMSSAGLRMLLSTYRRISDSGGRVILVGLSEELKETMSRTGFLDFFVTYYNLDGALGALSPGATLSGSVPRSS